MKKYNIKDIQNITDGNELLWIYNGLDCVLTHEIWEKLSAQIESSPEAKLIYSFERAMQAPAFAMYKNGLFVDQACLNNLQTNLLADSTKLIEVINRMACAIWDSPLNPGSPAQLKDMLYNILKLPEQFKFEKGFKKLTTNREALEKLLGVNPLLTPFIQAIMDYKDISKQQGMLAAGIDRDGFMRASFNVTGTETGRWSSNKNPFRTGTNFQNIPDKLRKIFVPIPGFKLAYIDLEQAESRVVAYLSGDENYINACESSDLHTTVCRMVWADLAWTGDQKYDKKHVAGQPFYRTYSYRDMAKRGGHGTNYYGKPRTMAMHLKVETKVMEVFQQLYFEAFPGIRRWHQEIATKLQTERCITTPLGRKRYFFERPDDDATLREAIAFVPQSTIGDTMNYGIWKLWNKFNGSPDLRLCAQVHDAVLIMYREELEDTLLPQAMECIITPQVINGKTMIIPCSCECGWNWGHYDEKHNPNGLRDYTIPSER